MRMMSYRVELDADGGYLIANAECDWNGMPMSENRQAPALRISCEQSYHGRDIANLDDYVEPTTFDEDTDPELKDNYVRALHGDLPGWKLVGVNIDAVYISFMLLNTNMLKYELLNTKPSPYLRFTIEAPAYGGGGNKYLVETSEDDNGGGETTKFLKVTEYYATGKREIIFENDNLLKPYHEEDAWKYAYVIEYR